MGTVVKCKRCGSELEVSTTSPVPVIRHERDGSHSVALGNRAARRAAGKSGSKRIG